MKLFERLRARFDHVRDVLPGGYGRTSLAQEGEDLILERIFEHDAPGIYVDVGAHHPLRFSNTHLLYRRGWHGVNIDATPGSMLPFHKLRRRDINLELGIGAKDELRDFYIFKEPALNTFDASRVEALRGCHVVEAVCKVRCAPLATILREHDITHVDLLTIDVEGFDFEVLQTVDWDRTRPRVLVTEELSRDMAALVDSELHSYLHERGYRLVAKTFSSVFYLAS